MATREIVPEKVQEAIFNELLGRPENRECADCKNKSPTWASIDFGVLVCIRCSGYHRNLGPSITRVRSTKLDSWEKKNVEIMQNMTNKGSNDFWEYKIPKSFKRLETDASPEECKRFVNEKYIRKSYAPQGHLDPVKEYLQQVKNGTFVERKKEEPKVVEREPPRAKEQDKQKRKRTISLEKEKKPTKVETAKVVQQVDLFDSFGSNDVKVAPANMNSNTSSTNATFGSASSGQQSAFAFNWNSPTTTNSTTAETTNKASGQFDFFDFTTAPVQSPDQTKTAPTASNGQPQQTTAPETKKLDILSLYSGQGPSNNSMGQNGFMQQNYNNFNGMMYNQQTQQTNGFNYPMNMNNGMGQMGGQMGQMGQMNGFNGMVGGMQQQVNSNPYGGMQMNNGYSNGMVGYGMNGTSMSTTTAPTMNQFQNGYGGGQFGYNNNGGFQGGFNAPTPGMNQYGQASTYNAGGNAQSFNFM
jgi:stromal membrane-associated protein